MVERVPGVIVVQETLQHIPNGDPVVAALFGQITKNFVAETLHACIAATVVALNAVADIEVAEPGVMTVPDTVHATA